MIISNNKISNKCKIIICILLIATLAVGFCANMNMAECTQNTRGIALIDCESGLLIYGENPDQIKEMASTTKIFTAYFVLEKCEKDNIDMQVPRKIKRSWTGVEGSSIYLLENEEVSIEELLYGLMLRSGNDSAVALSEIVFGTCDKYVEYANSRLKQMGYKNTTLQNPHGLPAQNHHTTARELATFSAMAMQNPLFEKIVSSKSYSGKRTLYANKNKILQNVKGGNGVKTGYTKSAGRCLVSACKRDGNQIVLATLNTYDMFERSKAHLESFFSNYEYLDISEVLKSHAIPLEIWGKTAEIEVKNSVTKIPVPKGEKVKITVKTVKQLPFFTKSGTFVGNIEISTPNSLIFKEKLYTIKTCDEI